MELKLEELEKAVSELPMEQLRAFREWFENFEADLWDEQIEKDFRTGKFDALTESAVTEHLAGKTKQL